MAPAVFVQIAKEYNALWLAALTMKNIRSVFGRSFGSECSERLYGEVEVSQVVKFKSLPSVSLFSVFRKCTNQIFLAHTSRLVVSVRSLWRTPRKPKTKRLKTENMVSTSVLRRYHRITPENRSKRGHWVELRVLAIAAVRLIAKSRRGNNWKYWFCCKFKVDHTFFGKCRMYICRHTYNMARARCMVG